LKQREPHAAANHLKQTIQQWTKHMTDQAQILRQLVDQRRRNRPPSGQPRPNSKLTVIGVTSGNGGAGKTSIALNLALALQEHRHVCLWDVAGTATLEILCGCPPISNLSQAFDGTKHLSDVLTDGPWGMRLLAGPGLSMLRQDSRIATERIASTLEFLRSCCEVLVLDLPMAADREMQGLLEICTQSLLVASPDPVSVTAAYSVTKMFRHSNWSFLVNRANSAEEAIRVIDRVQETSRLFLQQSIDSAGYIPEDPEFPRSSRLRKPLLSVAPQSAGAGAIQRLAERIETTAIAGTGPVVLGKSA
jgi:flagellar biosynthesis protein FlhG